MKEKGMKNTDVKDSYVKGNYVENNTVTDVKKNIEYLWKWLLLVWLNAIVGFYFGSMVSKEFGFICGMAMGVSVFALPYAYLAKYAGITNNKPLLKSLYISVFAKMICQILVFPDMYAGIFALTITESILSTSMENTFLYAFIATVLTGVFLSVLVMILTGVLYLFVGKDKKNKSD